MCTIFRDIVSAIILSTDNKILFGKKDKTKGGVYADYWHIPGGGVDVNETREKALQREVLEEVGINIDGLKIALVDDTGNGESEKVLKDTGEKVLCKMKFYTYSVQLLQDALNTKIVLSDDLVLYKWVDKKHLDSIRLTPPSVELFHKLKWI